MLLPLRLVELFLLLNRFIDKSLASPGRVKFFCYFFSFSSFAIGSFCLLGVRGISLKGSFLLKSSGHSKKSESEVKLLLEIPSFADLSD